MQMRSEFGLWWATCLGVSQPSVRLRGELHRLEAMANDVDQGETIIVMLRYECCGTCDRAQSVASGGDGVIELTIKLTKDV
jgi:hypothetical protein